MEELKSLWDDEVETSDSQRAKEILEKAKKKPKQVKVLTEKSINSKTVSIEDKLFLIRSNVLRILGVYKENTVVIKTREQFTEYINEALKNGIIAVDTETNNSLDPISCKLMGLCLYTPGQKNAYIPINHENYRTGERLYWQLTEKDVFEELSRINAVKPEVVPTVRHRRQWTPDYKGQPYEEWYEIHVKPFLNPKKEACDIIFHNAKFDYEVIYCTCGIKLRITWDTLFGAKIMDENVPAGLKWQYINYIDPSIEKYDIEHLFKGIMYAVVDPDIFALYAATDSYMTYMLYLFQLEFYNKPENAKLFYIVSQVEIPVIEVTASMELAGVTIDEEYSKRLSKKYHRKSEDIDKRIAEELSKYAQTITQWRQSSEANELYVDENGKKAKKSKAEQLDNPMTIESLNSPTQLAIFLYDILKVPVVDKKNPRGTGEDFMQAIADSNDMPICKLILEKRGIEKLIGTYIDKLPECVSPVDHRLHAHFNQYGAACVTKDTMILTDKGYKCIGNLFDGTEKNGEFYEDNTIVVNKNLQYENASHRVAYYNYPTKKITLRGGLTIEGTYNHPIICSKLTYADIVRNKSDKQITRLPENADFKQLDQIQINDIVAVPYGYNIFPTEYQKLPYKKLDRVTNGHIDCIMPEYMNEDFAELLGMYHADGSMRNDVGQFRIRINNHSKEVQNRFAVLVKRLFDIDCHFYDDCVQFNCTQLSELAELFVHGARNKNITNIIKCSPKSVVCAYIKGITLDSSFDKNRERLFITCANKEASLFIQSALLNIGIIPQYRNGVYHHTYDHMGNSVEPLNVIRIGVSGEMYKKFIDEIGVIESSKLLIKDSYKKSTFLTYDNVYYAYVTKIEDSTNDVYDLHIPVTHSFISNGMISHNTGRYSSSDPNLQNIPSHEKSIRMMFRAAIKNHTVEEDSNNVFVVPYTDEVEIVSNVNDSHWELPDNHKWVKVKELKVGDAICVNEPHDNFDDYDKHYLCIITSITVDENKNYKLVVENV